jgi:methionyl-tRNA formyltransferase
MRVIFAGTPEFARMALEQLQQAGFDIALVLTQPDRPAGRGMKLQASPVKQRAESRHIPLAQPRSLRLDGKYPEDAAAAREAIRAARADVMVVAAYGLILPQWVLDDMSAQERSAGPPQASSAPPGGRAAREAASVGAQERSAGPPQASSAPPGGRAACEAASVGAQERSAGPPQASSAPPGGSAAREAASVGARKLGCLNIHASLLPRWRGAAPIHRAIEAGDLQTGITVMQMDAGLDTGAMLLTETLAIGTTDTTGMLHDRLAALGGKMIVQALALAGDGALTATPQPEDGVSYARKIDKAEALIDWRQPASVIERKVRAFNPAPGAATSLDGSPLKIFCSVIDSCLRPSDKREGAVLLINETGIAVQCGDGVLRITELQRTGGKRLPAAEFLRGTALVAGTVLGLSGAAPEK